MLLGEYSWQEFQKLNHINNLPLNEQVRQYNFYLDSLANQRMWQNKGKPSQQSTPQETFLILQENSDYVLQENGDKLIWKL